MSSLSGLSGDGAQRDTHRLSERFLEMRLRTLGAAAATAGLLVAGSIPASAHGQDDWGRHGVDDLSSSWHPGHGHNKPPVLRSTTTVAEHLTGPLTFDVNPWGSLVVGQVSPSPDVPSLLSSVKPGQAPTTLVEEPLGTDLAAVSSLLGSTTFATRVGDFESVSSSLLMRRSPNGTVTQVADLLAYEQANNPDAVNTYGFEGLTPECLAMVPPFLAPAPGGVDSHGYGSLMLPGITYVADAGGNDVLSVDRHGTVRTVAVLPPAAFVATAEAAAGIGLPDCVVGATVNLEPVATDVELGPDGWLYVTSLPGGPEDGSLGNLGSVYKVNPRTGAVKLLATGLAGATGVAVSPDGTVFVAELYANQVSTVSRNGTVTPLGAFTQPAGIEWQNGRLYISTNVFGDGSIVAAKVR